AVADCTGHGVPGAFMSMLGISLLNDLHGHYSKFDPAFILGTLRAKIRNNLHQSNYMETNTDGMDMGLVIINTQTNEAVFSGGNVPLWLYKNGEISIINPDRMPVGVYIGEDQPFTNHYFQINRGDALYLFSDGYCDQFGGEKGRKLMQNGFLSIVRKCVARTPGEQKQILYDELIKWQGQQRQIDDILVIGVIFS
ncbi:MAG TPA: PP2C family protein-serine/threonine phosphatase, partial [Salinivirgaceae bacterium]|nr:PP2C family protein-serine/threonine phosphatase [Salinivirgaceae bacterium]